jgi:hypothetical protein
MNVDNLLIALKLKYKISDSEFKYIDKIIKPIYEHKEFKRRLTNEFLHHSNITLGEHILEDTFLTYKKCLKKKNIDTRLAIIIAMIHDLYTVHWQNNKENNKEKFFNKHGFTHPLEAVINSIVWYPEIFKDKNDSKIIIDGIIHHMYPLPVRVFDPNSNSMELNNYGLVKKIDKDLIDMIVESTKRGRIGNISISRSKYKEGRIMSKADKRSSRKEIKNISSAKALLTGKNKKIK